MFSCLCNSQLILQWAPWEESLCVRHLCIPDTSDIAWHIVGLAGPWPRTSYSTRSSKPCSLTGSPAWPMKGLVMSPCCVVSLWTSVRGECGRLWQV